MKERFLLRFELSNYFGLLPGILLPFCFDCFYPFFDSGKSKRDLFLLLLQLFQRNDLIAQLGEIGRLRSAFAPEVDFTFLEQASFVTKRDSRPLTPDLQPDFTEPCANEAHFSQASSDSANFANTLKSSSVVVSPVTFAPLAISFRSRRMILPLRVFGSASAKRTSSGLAIALMRTATCSRNSSFSPAVVSTPVFTVTKAPTPWPFNSSGLPTTAASATRGWLTSALSISDVPSLWPATFRTSSIRPTIQK